MSQRNWESIYFTYKCLGNRDAITCWWKAAGVCTWLLVKGGTPGLLCHLQRKVEWDPTEASSFIPNWLCPLLKCSLLFLNHLYHEREQGFVLYYFHDYKSETTSCNSSCPLYFTSIEFILILSCSEDPGVSLCNSVRCWRPGTECRACLECGSPTCVAFEVQNSSRTLDQTLHTRCLSLL